MGKSQGTRNEEESHSKEWIQGFLRGGGPSSPTTRGAKTEPSISR